MMRKFVTERYAERANEKEVKKEHKFPLAFIIGLSNSLLEVRRLPNSSEFLWEETISPQNYVKDLT